MNPGRDGAGRHVRVRPDPGDLLRLQHRGRGRAALRARSTRAPIRSPLDQARANLASAEAQLRKDQANLTYAKRYYERDRGLLETGVVSQDDVDSERSDYEQARRAGAARRGGDAAAPRGARRRPGEPRLHGHHVAGRRHRGVAQRRRRQTVAASFQTPTLFLIAQDLTKMQVDTNVSESDVGGSRRSARRRPSRVEAYPGPDLRREGRAGAQGADHRPERRDLRRRDRRRQPRPRAPPRHDGERAHRRRASAEARAIVPVRALRFDPNGARGSAERAAARKERQRVWVLRDGRPTAVPVSDRARRRDARRDHGGELGRARRPGHRRSRADGAGGRAADSPARSPFRVLSGRQRVGAPSSKSSTLDPDLSPRRRRGARAARRRVCASSAASSSRSWARRARASRRS